MSFTQQAKFLFWAAAIIAIILIVSDWHLALFYALGWMIGGLIMSAHAMAIKHGEHDW